MSLSLPQKHCRTLELFAGLVHLIKMFVQMRKMGYFVAVDENGYCLHVAVKWEYRKGCDFDIVGRCDGVVDDVDGVVVDVELREKDLH